MPTRRAKERPRSCSATCEPPSRLAARIGRLSVVLAQLGHRRHNRVVHDRRARPTTRVLRDNLSSGWTDVTARRALTSDRLEVLCPLAELPHPLIEEACGQFGSDP